MERSEALMDFPTRQSITFVYSAKGQKHVNRQLPKDAAGDVLSPVCNCSLLELVGGIE
jgi:hypothetical protein